ARRPLSPPRLTRPREISRIVQRRGSTDVVLQQPIELFAKRVVFACGVVAGRQLFDRAEDRLVHEPPPVCPEIPACIRIASSEDRSRRFSLFHLHAALPGGPARL